MVPLALSKALWQTSSTLQPVRSVSSLARAMFAAARNRARVGGAHVLSVLHDKRAEGAVEHLDGGGAGSSSVLSAALQALAARAARGVLHQLERVRAVAADRSAPRVGGLCQRSVDLRVVV